MALNVPVATHTPRRETAALPLADLDLGGQATILEVSLEGPARERLLDLGFVPGTPITLLRRAPLGDPCVYALRGVQMCLRATEAARISVQPVSPPGA
jgi:ferrous iron transport protein A